MFNIASLYTGFSLNIVFFFRFFKNIPDSGLSLFSPGVSVCTHTRQVENKRCICIYIELRIKKGNIDDLKFKIC